MTGQVPVGIVGATGYAGQELVRLVARHRQARLAAVMASGASAGSRLSPALARVWDGTVASLDVDTLARDTKAVFLALPDQLSSQVAPALASRGVRVLDLSGAFRLRDQAARRRWYPEAAEAGSVEAVYGLTEHNRDAIRSARLVSCPGCYPTAALLALRPLLSAGLIDGEPIIDAKSGVSGAGKAPSERTHFSEVHGSLSAYGVFSHRHGAEIEQELARRVTFVPHLVPLDRGILETIYVRLPQGAAATDVAAAYQDPYREAPFVRLAGDWLPEIKHVVHTNFCDIGWRLDPEGRRLVVVSVLDNLVKGAAGQALQNFNVMFGFDECEGLR
jgi:N-acetyl-gamma-glutamyl-phosphate reductase